MHDLFSYVVEVRPGGEKGAGGDLACPVQGERHFRRGCDCQGDPRRELGMSSFILTLVSHVQVVDEVRPVLPRPGDYPKQTMVPVDPSADQFTRLKQTTTFALLQLDSMLIGLR